jgi:hypothetical protein
LAADCLGQCAVTEYGQNQPGPAEKNRENTRSSNRDAWSEPVPKAKEDRRVEEEGYAIGDEKDLVKMGDRG